jgi:hypothetical protein
MMTSPSVPLRLRSLALLLSLGALALGGCQQDLGGRCEQGSDCSSGWCGGSQLGMASAMGATCTPGPGTVPFDAAPTDTSSTNDAGAEAGDAKSEAGAETGDARSDGGAEAGDAGAEAGDGATSGDGPSEAGPDGAEAGASEAGSDAPAEAGATEGGATG